MSTGVIYQEMVGLGRLAATLCGGCLALIAVAAATDYPWRGGMVLLAAFGLQVAWVVWGIYRMNRIVLTPDRLVVGVEAFAPSDLDVFFGVQPTLVLRPEEQERVEEAWPLPPDGDIRIAGGSWGRRIGTATVLLRDARTEQTLAVFSRRPVLFTEHVATWLTAVPDTPAELVERSSPPDG